MIELQLSGSFGKLESFLKRMSKFDVRTVMEAGAKEGVAALARATPIQTGLASQSWSYEISSSGGVYEIAWTNSDVENGFPVVIMLQYGHGTGTGGYVQGRDFINPAIEPVFKAIADKVWKAVTSA